MGFPEDRMSDTRANTTARRGFLGTAGSLMILKPQTAFGSQANSAVEIGLLGCGGRGPWVAGLFQEFVGARVVALHDPFQDRLEAARQTLKSDSARLYKGLRAYEELVASKLDAVAIVSPPYFHPEQVAAAIAAGKHVYLAKPMAVDVPGCRSILASGEKARGRLSFWVDFQFRAKPVFQEMIARIRRGDIGVPVVGHFYYHTGRLPRKDKPGTPEGEARLRNWVFDKVLSGDIIVEQNIHSLDAGQWMLGTRPVKACGTGGRKVRVDVGDCWDHFVVTFWYPDDVKVDFSSSQCIKGYNDICARVYGSLGTAEGHYGGAAVITGDNPWKGAERDDTGREGTILNIRKFVDSLRSGQWVNNVPESVDSNLTAILGRMAAYRQTMVTWDEMMRSNEKLEANLAL
jgi:myo-inositol 2-dehydrogenase / D-chiro-inositol 1-dehydrogenase